MTMQVVHPNSNAAINPQLNAHHLPVLQVLKATEKYVFLLIPGHTPRHSTSNTYEFCYTIDQCDCVLYVFNIVSNRWKKVKLDAEQQKPCCSRVLTGICNEYMLMFDTRFIQPSRNPVVQRLMMLPLTVKAKANPWIPMNYTGIAPGVGVFKNMMPCPTKPHRFYMRKYEFDEGYYTHLGFEVYSLKVDVSTHTGEWEHIGKYPLGEHGSDDHCAVLYNGKIVTICVNRGGNSLRYMYVREFDVDSKECKTNVTLPDNNHGWPRIRWHHAVVHHRHCLYLIGGSNINDMWQLNLDKPGVKPYQWKKLPFRLHRNLDFLSAAVTPQGCLYVFGGLCSNVRNGQRPPSDLARMWLSPAPLRQLALQRVQQLQPNLKLHSATDLAVYGIPTDIIQDIKQNETEFIE